MSYTKYIYILYIYVIYQIYIYIVYICHIHNKKLFSLSRTFINSNRIIYDRKIADSHRIELLDSIYFNLLKF